MKRALSILLVVLLVVASTMLLVACGGGVKSEQQWNDAMDYLKTCDSITINYTQNKTTNGRIYTVKDTCTVIYDATKGLLYAESSSKTYNILNQLKDQSAEYQYVEVKDMQLINHTKSIVGVSPANWETAVQSYSSQDEALQELNNILASYVKRLGMDNFKYDEFTFKFNKYEKQEVVNQKNTRWQLFFSDGKLAEANYKTSHKKDSSDIDTTKISITIVYSADITTPTDLADAIR